MISERTLKRWRGDALKINNATEVISLFENATDKFANHYRECQQRILKLTQELMDQHLVRKP